MEIVKKYIKWSVCHPQQVKKTVKLVVFWYWIAVYWRSIGFVSGCKEALAQDRGGDRSGC
ncbi:hypothetical protein [Rugamonas apoptosis]|uniref:Uncharacterized protein n=1 Tax=Rugamonas apoptosis TaxID=2758570 RepID=A0A7W2FCY5_9BURK|nr:hypothetical protein [Rugamonas apoptosis]MBA5689471.1 hypothetical protein [Rugamonas apoptosis]